VTASHDTSISRYAFATHVAPAAIYVAAIFYGGLIRMATLPEVGPVPTDKLLHTAAFGGLALLMVRVAQFCFPRAPALGRLALGAGASSAVGALLELCQAFVPYRSSDFWDWLADSVGALLAVAALGLVLRFFPRRADG
jgi:VanZ family protein